MSALKFTPYLFLISLDQIIRVPLIWKLLGAIEKDSLKKTNLVLWIQDLIDVLSFDQRDQFSQAIGPFSKPQLMNRFFFLLVNVFKCDFFECFLASFEYTEMLNFRCMRTSSRHVIILSYNCWLMIGAQPNDLLS